MRSEQQLQQLPSGEFSTGDTKYEGRLNQALAASQVRGDGMLRSLVGILIVFLLVPAFGQMKADYQPGTITAVVPIESSSPLEAPVRESIEADPPQAPTKAILVIGATGVKDNSNGSLIVEKGNLHFVHSKDTVDIPAPSITDLITGSDSQRVIRGTAGTISMFGPYGSGRFLSLFRSKLDTLTLQYRDPDGGLHGAIFTMSVGSAELLKQQLIAQGAHSTVEAEKPAGQETSKLSGTTEQKP